MSILIENLRKDMQKREEADNVMSAAWAIVPLLPVVAILLFLPFMVLSMMMGMGAGAVEAIPVGAIAPLLSLIVIVPAFIIAGAILSIVLLYKLIKRRNTHFSRVHFLFDDLPNLIRDEATKKNVDVEIPLSSYERTLREVKEEEERKGAVLWAILSAVTGIAAFYVYYFLMRDVYKHERGEDALLEDAGRCFTSVDIELPSMRREEPMPNRSFILYLILTFITLGIFGIYWNYVLIKDPNEHFKHHRLMEDQLLQTLMTRA